MSHCWRLACFSSSGSLAVSQAGFTWALLHSAVLTQQGPPNPHQASHPLSSGFLVHLPKSQGPGSVIPDGGSYMGQVLYP